MIDWENTVRKIRRAVVELDHCLARARRENLCRAYREICDDAQVAIDSFEPLLWEIEWHLPVDPFPQPQESYYAASRFPAKAASKI